jgi:hypothetical protein
LSETEATILRTARVTDPTSANRSEAQQEVLRLLGIELGVGEASAS